MVEWILFILADIIFVLEGTLTQEHDSLSVIIGMFLLSISYTLIKIKESIDNLRQ